MICVDDRKHEVSDISSISLPGYPFVVHYTIYPETCLAGIRKVKVPGLDYFH